MVIGDVRGTLHDSTQMHFINIGHNNHINLHAAVRIVFEEAHTDRDGDQVAFTAKIQMPYHGEGEMHELSGRPAEQLLEFVQTNQAYTTEF